MDDLKYDLKQNYWFLHKKKTIVLSKKKVISCQEKCNESKSNIRIVNLSNVT